jgi:hypothetical protein
LRRPEIGFVSSPDAFAIADQPEIGFVSSPDAFAIADQPENWVRFVTEARGQQLSDPPKNIHKIRPYPRSSALNSGPNSGLSTGLHHNQ